MPYYKFRQNNSGGEFVYDPDRGLSTYVLVEAENREAANERFLTLGGYFGGVADGYDCSCCGDRWHDLNDWNEPCTEVPEKDAVIPEEFYFQWVGVGNYDGFVHPLEGDFYGFSFCEAVK